MKKAVLLAAYGATGVQNNISLKLFEDKVREEFPGISIRWAFTSLRMRNRLAAERKKSDSVEKALCRLAFEKFGQVAVQSLHVIPGREYQDLLQEIDNARQSAALSDSALADISIGLPLLNNQEDLQLAARAMLASSPPERQPEDFMLWVGHGSQHTGQVSYARLAEEAAKLDPNMLIGTLDDGVEKLLPLLGSPESPSHPESPVQSDRQNTLGSPAATGRTIWLLPLLAVIGKHAREDLAGSGTDSWQSRLEAQGFACRPILRGMIEYPAFTELWVRHLKESAFRVF
ncbi:MAG: sirohydrochlorin cobaltochelatase [Deltaproteobacteria bacterium]|jgi:sirohydrochlorin cobaltochelatase|nr:sirohydrochlorin cobaltochelatase [Deltaproteobacteria bacterium]